MTCEPFILPNGSRGIACFKRDKPKRCACGRPATQLCDWKVPTRKSGTCDKPVCTSCAVSPAPDKDLCQVHAAEYEQWKARKK